MTTPSQPAPRPKATTSRPRATNQTRSTTRSDTSSFVAGAAIAMFLLAVILLGFAYLGEVAWMSVAAVVFALLLVACAVGLLRRHEWARVAGGATNVALALTAFLLPFLTDGKVSLGLLWPAMLIAVGAYLLLPSTKQSLAEIRAQGARRREAA